mmetsp:Transcript_1536/g.3924  ORF Transcript_1536/g.3924 Transcript_1536/m.3924 type:complete len:129 (-) Transcript_1536:210-596(-)
MPAQFRAVCRARGLSPGDFPDIQRFTAVARELDFSAFPKISGTRMRKGKALADLETALTDTIPALMEFLPRGNANKHAQVAEPTDVDDPPPLPPRQQDFVAAQPADDLSHTPTAHAVAHAPSQYAKTG